MSLGAGHQRHDKFTVLLGVVHFSLNRHHCRVAEGRLGGLRCCSHQNSCFQDGRGMGFEPSLGGCGRDEMCFKALPSCLPLGWLFPGSLGELIYYHIDNVVLISLGGERGCSHCLDPPPSVDSAPCSCEFVAL